VRISIETLGSIYSDLHYREKLKKKKPEKYKCSFYHLGKNSNISSAIWNIFVHIGHNQCLGAKIQLDSQTFSFVAYIVSAYGTT
jgi:hypothetical protein